MITSGWEPLDAETQAFLTEFERHGANPGPASGEQFADQFLTADPDQSAVVTREMLVASLPYRQQMFAQAGVGVARCVSASQLRLDDQHALVTSDWDAERAGADPVRLESTFLLRREPDGPRILAYLNHRRIAAVLKALQA